MKNPKDPNPFQRTAPDGANYEGATPAELLDAVFTAHINEIGARTLNIQRRFERDMNECARQLDGCLEDGDFAFCISRLRDYIAETGGDGHPDGLVAWLAQFLAAELNMDLKEAIEEVVGTAPAGSN